MTRWLAAIRSNTLAHWTLAIAGGFSAMAMLLFAFIYWQVAVNEQARIDAIIQREAAAMRSAAPTAVAAELDAWLAKDMHDVLYAGLFDSSGRRLSGNVPVPPADLGIDGQPHRASIGVADHDRDGDGAEVVRAVAMRLDDGRLLVVGYDLDELDEIDDIIYRALRLGLAPMLLLSVLGGLLLTLRAQRRIAAIHRAVARIRRGQLRERLPVRGSGDDLDTVSATVNAMLDDIERLVDEIRGVGDNIAHDVRTPLTRVRARLERAREEADTRDAFQAACDHAMRALDQALAVVGAVLRIADIEHGRRRSSFEPVALDSLLTDATDLFAPLAEERGIRLMHETFAVARVFGDADLLLEAIGNLIDNAVKFAPANSEVSVSLTREGAHARLCLRDRGPGIPPAERERVIQRFYRMDKSRTIPGNGLGLSFVSAVMTLHDFQWRIDDARPGCQIDIMCPLSPSDGDHVADRGPGDRFGVAKRAASVS